MDRRGFIKLALSVAAVPSLACLSVTEATEVQPTKKVPPKQEYELGTCLHTSDGRVFRYVQAGKRGLAPGELIHLKSNLIGVSNKRVEPDGLYWRQTKGPCRVKAG